MKKNKSNIIYIIIIGLFVTIITSMTIGFASLEALLPLNGKVSVKPYTGKVEITNITYKSGSNVVQSSNPTYNELTGNIFLNLTNDTAEELKTFTATYEVELTNDTIDKYVYSGIDFSSTVTINNTTYTDIANCTVTGIAEGDELAAGEVKIITLQLTYTFQGDIDDTATNTLNAEFTIDETSEITGSLLISSSPTTGNLKDPNTKTSLKLDVINSFSYTKNVNLILSNNNFYIVDSKGNKITQINVPANSTNKYNYYIMAKEDASFPEEKESVTITASSDGISTITVGTMVIDVDKEEIHEKDPPVLGNAILTMNDQKNQATADWTLVQEETGVASYQIQLYTSTGTLKNTVTSTANTYQFSNIAEGEYYIIVYGIDELGNSGASSVSSATTANGYATKSANTKMKWTFSVTNNLTNLTSNGAATVDYKKSYTATLTPKSQEYAAPETVTITMAGKTLTAGTDYTYSGGKITINSVTGDINITAEAANGGCLVEGTKVLLSDNTYKNIEDITYEDLLKVINFDNGKETSEYPIWIEKKGQSSKYKKITFCDNTELKTVYSHGIYIKELNKFVDVESEEFIEGLTTYKYINNKLKEVKIKKIEEVYEKANYYQVISTTYYNIIANNIITTDGHVELVNLYNFNDNLTWKEDREDITKDKNNLFTYKELQDVMPYYMYKGLRANEVKYILNKYNFDYNNLYILKNGLTTINNNLLYNYPTINNERYFTVSFNNKKIKVKEGKTIILPKDNKVKYWYNTVDNKLYLPGTPINIELSTHFISIN